MTLQFLKGIDQYGIKFKPKRGIGYPRNLWIIENLGAQNAFETTQS